jgi:hypothetical protein
MHKIVCLALGHRCRVVQEFAPTNRRLKCERCGGDWSMDDQLRLLVEWHTDFEQFWRDRGFEILEPLPAWRSVPLEPLTGSEFARACRWPVVLAITLNWMASYILEAEGSLNFWQRLLAVTAIGCAIARFLGQRAIDRAYERKCNSLEA